MIVGVEVCASSTGLGGIFESRTLFRIYVCACMQEALVIKKLRSFLLVSQLSYERLVMLDDS
jgi:hypothetical protein